MVNDCGVRCANGFITARQGCRALQVCFAQYKCRAEACLRRCRNYQARTNLFVCTVCRFAERMGHAPSLQPSIENRLWGGGMPPPGYYQIRTYLFVCSVCRFADGTPSGRALRSVYRNPTVGRIPLAGATSDNVHSFLFPTSRRTVRTCRPFGRSDSKSRPGLR